MSTSNSIQRSLQTLAMLAVFLVASSAITLATLAHRPKQLTITPKVQPAPAPKAALAPAATPKQATTNASVYVRSAKGTNSSILGVLDSGATVTLGNDSDVNWQEITAGSLHGYVFKAYLKY